MKIFAIDDEPLALEDLVSAIRAVEPDAEICGFPLASAALDDIARAAPAPDVMTAMVLGKAGSGFLCAGSKRPSAASFFLSCSKAAYRSPIPCGISAVT